eukprot:3202248-Rhodomonas_salina.1
MEAGHVRALRPTHTRVVGTDIAYGAGMTAGHVRSPRPTGHVPPYSVPNVPYWHRVWCYGLPTRCAVLREGKCGTERVYVRYWERGRGGAGHVSELLRQRMVLRNAYAMSGTEIGQVGTEIGYGGAGHVPDSLPAPQGQDLSPA